MFGLDCSMERCFATICCKTSAHRTTILGGQAEKNKVELLKEQFRGKFATEVAVGSEVVLLNTIPRLCCCMYTVACQLHNVDASELENQELLFTHTVAVVPRAYFCDTINSSFSKMKGEEFAKMSSELARATAGRAAHWATTAADLEQPAHRTSEEAALRKEQFRGKFATEVAVGLSSSPSR